VWTLHDVSSIRDCLPIIPRCEDELAMWEMGKWRLGASPNDYDTILNTILLNNALLPSGTANTILYL
jgi:hypothetical protein